MRYLLVLPFLLSYTMAVLGQSVFPVEKMLSQPALNTEWDLSKYVWSQSHPRIAKDEKPLLDFNAIDNWMEVGDDRDVTISGDGKYVSYNIIQGGYKLKKLVIQSIFDSWRQEFSGMSPGFFSVDSKQYIFSGRDTLCFLLLGESKLTIVTGVASFIKPLNGKNEWLAWQEKNDMHAVVLKNLQTGKEERFDSATAYNFNGTSEWLAIQLANEKKELVLYNLQTGLQQRYPLVTGYVFAENGNALLLKTITHRGNGTATELKYVDPIAPRLKCIWPLGNEEETVNSYSINGDGKQVVFVVQGPKEFGVGGDKTLQHSVWYWRDGMDKPVMRSNEAIAGVEGGLFIKSAFFFF